MGVFTKLKNIFYDEEIIETEPTIKEVSVPNQVQKNVASKNTKNDEPIINKLNERELFKSEPTFKFPIFEEEEEFKKSTLGSRSNNVMDYEKRQKLVKDEKKEIKKEEKTVFKPSPIISPIYGILNKEYEKEEIVKKNKETTVSSETEYDKVRNKAYGILEGELNQTMPNITKETVLDVEEIIDDLEEELDKTQTNIENLLNEIEKNTNLSIGKLEENYMENEERNEEKKEEFEELEEFDSNEFKLKKEVNHIDEVGDKTLEHDLFNLIDSMYEEEEEEE